MAQPQELPHGLASGRVLLRFCARIIILASCAVFGSIGFGRSFATLLWMAMVFSAVGAMIKREPPLASVLNGWDEMMGYAAILALLGVFDHPLPA